MDLPLIAGDGNAAGCDGNRPLDVHRFVCEAARTAPAAVTSRCLAIGPFHLSIDGAAAWDAEDLVGDQMSSPRPSNCSPHEFPVQFRLRCWPSLPATGRLQQTAVNHRRLFFHMQMVRIVLFIFRTKPALFDWEIPFCASRLHSFTAQFLIHFPLITSTLVEMIFQMNFHLKSSKRI